MGYCNKMKFNRLVFFALAGMMMFGCQQAELLDPTENGDLKMKTVTISAGMNLPETKASIDSESGAVAWQESDVISILASDNKFYEFALKSGADRNVAEFEGQIPEGETITKVATYPVLVKNGGRNTVLSGTTLNYVIQNKMTFSKFNSNVPLVATFEDGAEYLSFKQVGGVIRFPINNLPAKSSVILATTDKTITGKFPIDVTALGEAAMVVSGTKASTVTMKYESEQHALKATVNFPVPTGTFSNFTLTVKDVDGVELFTKTYTKEHTVNRGNLLIMNEITLPELPVQPISGAEVWPYFVDARVIFPKSEDAEQYAVYIDGATEPVFVDAEDWGDKDAVLIGGDFAHNSTHTVEIAKIVNGQADPETKSAPLTFTTSDVFQLTTNTGTQFVSVGWNDVTIANGPKYVNGKWTAVSSALEPSVDEQGRDLNQRRGYRVQLLDSDKATIIYDMVPFSGHTSFQNPFSESSLLGMVDGKAIITPTALSFGYLEPGKDYYFRVKTLGSDVVFDESNGNYAPETNTSNPYPFPISSERGACAWSEPVKLSTDPVHVPSANEILYEGFDDIMITSDIVNWASAVVPDFDSQRQTFPNYYAGLKTRYPAFVANNETFDKTTVWDFHTYLICAADLGFFDLTYATEVPNLMNANAGDLEGWSLMSYGANNMQSMYPFFGAVGLGQDYTSHGGSSLISPAINSDLLVSNKGTKCKVTVNVSYAATNKGEVAHTVYLQVYRNGAAVGLPVGLEIPVVHPDEWASDFTPYHSVNDADMNSTNYVHHQRYYTMEYEFYLRKGDSIRVGKNSEKPKYGFLLVGDIKVEAYPGELEPDSPFVDNGVGTEPDNTNYDVFGLGEIPVSYFYGPPTAFYTKYDANGAAYYDYELTKQTYQDVKDAGFNIAIYNGELDYSTQENIRIAGICEELGLKFIGHNPHYASHAERVKAIKDAFGNSSTYLGEYLADEPNASTFPDHGNFVKEFMKEIPDKEVYINLFPMYAKTAQTGSVNYEDHVADYLDIIPTKSVSFDFYGLKTRAELKLDYYRNLDLVRDLTFYERKPFWVITQAGPIGTDTIDPTEEEQRWTVWSNLAMGSKGISYFTYYTPVPEAGLGASEYMLRRDGSKRDMYYYIQRINADINTIGKKLLHCHADGCIMSSVSLPLHQNDGKGRTIYGPILKVSAADPTKSFFVGCFRDARVSENGDNYKGYKAMVVSKFHNRDISADLKIADSITEITFTHNNTSETLQLASGLSTKVGKIGVSFVGDNLKLDVPMGEAVLIEF